MALVNINTKDVIDADDMAALSRIVENAIRQVTQALNGRTITITIPPITIDLGEPK
jgi:hypothetical protein